VVEQCCIGRTSFGGYGEDLRVSKREEAIVGEEGPFLGEGDCGIGRDGQEQE